MQLKVPRQAMVDEKPFMCRLYNSVMLLPVSHASPSLLEAVFRPPLHSSSKTVESAPQAVFWCRVCP